MLLQGHAVTLTFKVATQMLPVHIVHIATYSHTCTKFHAPSIKIFKLSYRLSSTSWQKIRANLGLKYKKIRENLGLKLGT